MRDIDEISGIVVDVALKLHRDLGPGLLESVYETLLSTKLEKLGLAVERQRSIAVTFEDIHFPAAFKADLIVDGRLVIEIKSVEAITKAHLKQVHTYLRLMEQPVGLLINFGGRTLKEGLRRVVNDYVPSASPRLRASA